MVIGVYLLVNDVYVDVEDEPISTPPCLSSGKVRLG